MTQTRLTDAEKLECFDFIRDRAKSRASLTASELAGELSTHLMRPISVEIARHQAKVCGFALKGSRGEKTASTSRVLNAICDVLEQISDNDPCVKLERRVAFVRHLLGRETTSSRRLEDARSITEEKPVDRDRREV